MKIISNKKAKIDSTDFALMVNTNDNMCYEDLTKEYILNILCSENICDKDLATTLSCKIFNKISSTSLDNITETFLTEITNLVLAQNGINKKVSSTSNVTIPFVDIEQIIENPNKENGNIGHCPESINLTIAEKVLKEYALSNVFSKEVATAHTLGNIHIHDLGMVDRFYCSGHSPEYVKKNGLKNIPVHSNTSAPANNALVFSRQLTTFTQFLSGQFAGAVGWEGVNIFFAPFLENMSYDEIYQVAQDLVWNFSELAGTRGGQLAFTDFNVYASIPEHYKEVYAMGPRGKFMAINENNEKVLFDTREEVEKFAANNNCKILKYIDYEKEAHTFAKAILEVVEKGDADGIPFAFPKINFHINATSFENEKAKELVMAACTSASKSGCPYFIFDRNACSVSQCCRLKIDFSEKDMALIKTPEELRFVGGQNVSINLPNIPLRVGADEKAFYTELEHLMELACIAHIERKNYLIRIMNSPNSPVKFYSSGMDGKPYIRLDQISWLIGIVGLNECVKNLCGQELHEANEAYLKGLEIIAFMNQKTKELAKKYNIAIKLEETPAESTAGRFAKLDIKHFGDKAFCKKNDFGVYYTNSIHFAADSDVDYITRLQKQSKFHTLVEAGSMIHIWGGEYNPNPMAIYNLLETTWTKTKCVQWVLSPEYTLCNDCRKRTNGLHETCPVCNSKNVRGLTRITGYYVFLDKFNSSKKAELADRKKEIIK